MAFTTRVCRLCTIETTSKRLICLTSNCGNQHKWSARIHSLLEVQVDCDDRLSPYICDSCKNRLISLRNLAKASKSQLEMIRGPLKRCKLTSGNVGVSPDISQETSFQGEDYVVRVR